MLMLTRRDLIVAALSIASTVAVAAIATPTLIGSSTYSSGSFPYKPTAYGKVAEIFNGPTATLSNLEMHITTLDPGQRPHPPHRHPNEELIIIRQGTVETLSNGKWIRLEPGSVIFNASNQVHDLRNVGSDPAIYHVVNFKSALTPEGTTVLEPDPTQK